MCHVTVTSFQNTKMAATPFFARVPIPLEPQADPAATRVALWPSRPLTHPRLPLSDRIDNDRYSKGMERDSDG